MTKRPKTILDHIDALIDELKKNKTIDLTSPDGQTEWQLRLNQYPSEPYTRLYVAWRPKGVSKWRRLNPGWRTAKSTPGFENKARIILGQIMVGKRKSGLALHDLNCSSTLADGFEERSRISYREIY